VQGVGARRVVGGEVGGAEEVFGVVGEVVGGYFVSLSWVVRLRKEDDCERTDVLTSGDACVVGKTNVWFGDDSLNQRVFILKECTTCY